MKRKDFYIFRHGQTDYNLQERWQGSGIDNDLNEVGRRQAQLLVDVLRPLNLEIIYSSPLRRAFHTAKIVSDALNIPIEIAPGLAEVNLGVAEGMFYSDILRIYPELYQQWHSRDSQFDDVGFAGGETKNQVRHRVLQTMNGILACQQNRIGISSHGAAIRHLFYNFGVYLENIPNTTVYHLVWEEGTWAFPSKNPLNLVRV